MQSELENATEKLSNMLESEDVIRWCKEDDQIDMINQTNQVHRVYGGLLFYRVYGG